MIRSASDAPQPFAAKFRAQVQTLHLADAVFKFMQRNASGELAIVFGQQQPSLGRSVVAGKSGQFLIEILKAQAEAQGLRVLEK